MFGRKKIDLSPPRALETFEAEIAASLRNLDFDETGKRLLAALGDCHSGYASLCKRIADRYVAVDGWDALWADLHVLKQKGTAVTAIGIDLSGYGDGPEPVLETAVYDDGAFPFSAADRPALLAASDGKRPWTGAFIEAPHRLAVRGLASVHKVIAPLHSLDHSHDKAAVRLAWWYVAFRVHHAIRRDLEKQGLPYSMPVIVGDHGFGIGFHSVYMARPGASRDRQVTEILKRRAKQAARAYEQRTEEIVRDLRERRRSYLTWRIDHNPAQRETYRGFMEAREAMTFKMLEIAVDRPTWRMDNPAFEAVLAEVRAARARRHAA